MIPVNQAGAPVGEIPFTRTGLLGFVGPVGRSCTITVVPVLCSWDVCAELNMSAPQGSLVFVVGKIEGLLMVSGRRHNADDLVATALAVEPVKTVYRGR